MTKRNNDMPGGWACLSGDVSWEDYGGSWYKKAPDGSYYVVAFTNMYEACGERDCKRDNVPQFLAEVRRVDLHNMPAAEVKSALRSYGWKMLENGDILEEHASKRLSSPGDEGYELMLVGALTDYGIYEPLGSFDGGSYPLRVRAAARRAAEQLIADHNALEEALNKPVNKLGATAREFGRGDMYGQTFRDYQKEVSRTGNAPDPNKNVVMQLVGDLTPEQKAAIDAERKRWGGDPQGMAAKLQGDNLKTAPLVRMKHSDIRKCPFAIIMPEHYRPDGSCKCDDPEHRANVMLKPERQGGWGYTAATFKRVGISVGENELPKPKKRQFKQYPLICAGCTHQWEGRQREKCPKCGSTNVHPSR